MDSYNNRDGRGMAPAGAVSGHLDDWEELAVDYLDGRLDPQSKAAIKAHLDGCPACAARVRSQRAVLAFLSRAELEDAPPRLEDEVLGEVLFPSEPPRTVREPVITEPSWWENMWRRKVRPWIPATVAVVALLAGVLSYGLLRGDSEGATMRSADMTTAAVASGGAANDSAAEQAAVPAATSAETEMTALGAGPTTTAGASTTTAAAKYGSAETTQDPKTMIADLEAAGTPVYFVFQATTPPGEGDGAAAAAGAAVAEQITALTGLVPLDGTLSLGGPTFAAFLPREDAKQLVDLLRSIGTSLQLSVGLAWEPVHRDTAPSGTEFGDRLEQRKAEFPELSAYRTPQPAVSAWSFTTSTLVPPAQTGSDNRDVSTPDEAGTHVLIVIYVGM